MIPAQVLAADRAAMAALPSVAPTTGTTVTTRLGRDYDVSIGANAYSVQPEAIRRMITVPGALDRVVARCADRVIADHERLWGTAELVSDPDHVRAASILRQQYLHPRTGTDDHVEVEVQLADLGAHDAVFGTGEVP
jgi:hypothetical protein